MRVRTARRLAWWGLAALLALGAAGSVLEAANGWRGVNLVEDNVFAAILIATALVGALIASRHPRNAIGWLMLAAPIVLFVGFVAEQYAVYSLLTRPGTPGGDWGAVAAPSAYALGYIPLPTFLFLLFPDGRLPSRRWRPVAWGIAATLGVLAAGALLGALDEWLSVDLPAKHPLGLQTPGWLDDVVGIAMVLWGLLGAACAGSLILRFRRSGGDERQQIKWLALAAGFMAVLFVAVTIAEAATGTTQDSALVTALATLAYLSLPVATGIAILKYRLYEIDVVIRKTVIVGLLAAFITVVYVAVVVGIGAIAAGAFQSRVLPIVAAVVIAVAFQPVRTAARRLADRLVLGRRATPYDVLSTFSKRVGTAYATEDLLPRMARVVGEGTAAVAAEVWLRLGERLVRSATWPPGTERPEPGAVPLTGAELPSLGEVSEALTVRHQGELLGAITVAKPSSEPLTPEEHRLLEDLAAQAGLVLRNVRLAEELRARLTELQASRQRIVAAQDEERRRLERNIHDGAQQQLVALSIKLGLARAVTRADPEKAEVMLAELQEQAQQALEDLRDLARGIYPPLLADRGLAAALGAQVRKGGLPVELRADGIGRYSQEVEAAVYFCVLEALQNVAKYARASGVRVALGTEEGDLWFGVSDDGRGFDPGSVPRGTGLTNMEDRISALGGSLRIESTPGAGTTITGRIPVASA